jgi:hypothetical protein
MPGIVDDLNYIFKKTLNVVDATTGANTVEYVYGHVKTGHEVQTKTKKNNARGSERARPIDTAGTGKTTLTEDNVFAAQQPGQSLYPAKGVNSRKYTVNKVTSGESGSKTEDGGDVITLGPAPRSLFNMWTVHRYANRVGGDKFSTAAMNGADYNKPVFQGAGDKNNMILNPTAKNIVEYSSTTGGECFTYAYSDFIQMEHYGLISNDYLITLRRFAYPVPDDILSPSQQGTDPKKKVDTSQPDLARAVTWLSPALGNDLKEILKFKTGFKWTEAKSEIQDAQSRTADRGIVGDKINASPLASAIESGLNGFTSVQAKQVRNQGQVDHMKETYPNKVFGPLNIIDTVMARDKGLVFEQEFKLTFHYDLKAYPGTSPKVAFMDTLANVLALTYNNAPFWGGAVRYSGNGSTGKPFGDMSKLASGDYAGYIGSIADTLAGMGGNFMDQLKKTASNIGSGAGMNKILGDSSILENIVGGGMMKLLGGPSGGDIIKAFLTGDPTGQWHVTIGNPMNPIIVCGNLGLQDSQVSFEGPLGFEGFPTKMKVEITLKPGRPRDKGEIESMFNAGRGRMYLQPEWGENGEEINVDAMINVDAYGSKSGRTGSVKSNAPFMSKLSDHSAG